MIPLFIGMTLANLLLLCGVFGLGLFVVGADEKTTSVYAYHISLAIAAAFVTLATHVGTYMYFMATSRWLQAATDKVGLEPRRFAAPALDNKRRSLPCIMMPILAMMAAAFAGAGADRTLAPIWRPEYHLAAGVIAIAVNIFAAMLEFKLIKAQGALMALALAILNQKPGVVVEQG